ncbi:MAG: leucine-rich repeat domain-containing protein [Prevotella sp.]|nr:leucine-rich repeat domain-containing protein [Prevotella sp.]
MKRKLLLALMACVSLLAVAQTGDTHYDRKNMLTFVKDGMFFTILNFDTSSKSGTVEFGGYAAVNDSTAAKEGAKNHSGIVDIPETVTSPVYSGVNHDHYEYDATYTVTAIRGDLFRFNKKITEVKLPKSLKLIEARVFDGCTSLTTVTFKDGVANSKLERIESHAFLDCSALTAIDIPSTVKYLGDPDFSSREGGVFEGCATLTEVTVPANITVIPNFTFKNCKNLEKVHYTGQVTHFGAHVYFGCQKIKWEDVVPTTITYMDNEVFMNSNLSSVDFNRIPDLKRIGNGVFWNTQLTTVQWPAALTEVPYNTFRDCKKLTSISGLPSQAGSWDNVTKIGHDAFNQCYALQTITLPTALKTIDDGAFRSCTSLATVNYVQGLKTIGNHAFANTPAIKKFFFLGSVKTLGDFAFQGSGLTCVHLKGDMTIGIYAFENCQALKYVEIPKGVSVIPTGFVKGATSLRFITIGEDVNTIHGDALANCTRLKYVYMLPSTPPAVQDGEGASTSLSDVDGKDADHAGVKVMYYVKSSALANYKDAAGWSVAADRIKDEIPVKMSSIEYAAISRDFPIDFKDATKPVEAYVGPSTYWVDNSRGHIKLLRMNKVDAVPRLTGVILKGTPGQTYTMKIYDDKSTLFDGAAANYIKDVKEDTTMVTVEHDNKAKYGLMADKMLHLLNDNSNYVGGTSYVEAENDIDQSSQAKIMLFFNDDVVAGIDEVGTMDDDYAVADDAYYTLTGVRLEKADRPGVYIHRGRKVIVR